ncbi:acetate kinase [Methylocella silvestris BL2]|uniref:Acetate kinase n=1 Tax=Methylocella silvestris (strain DSM 15510 / CIP 108128 / LMG 27833 / NCIMB 13906 / BL2) TaxID=395965 RepID=B8ERT0_METSB|nr:acetate/propionate family kinase [Methylocella silvestris]ACK51628.1 acetate kinase [Methylocella silvestris BL2]
MTTGNAIVVVNAGSSSIKFSLFREEGADLSVFLKGQIEGLYTDGAHFAARDTGGELVAEKRWGGETVTHDDAMRRLLDFVHGRLGDYRVDAVGHRIVHGGAEFSEPVRLTTEALARLERLTPLAPLHQPHNLAPVRTLLDIAPHIPQVGCFDTGFHASQPPLAQAFALPAEITERGVRRYGFHGLSYEYIASALPHYDPSLAQARVIVAHLGNGASLCALRAGRSVASTMGFTAVDGLPMGTRSGALDPGVILYLLDELKMGPREIERLLYKQSGLLGVSGVSSDMRSLEASDNPRARLAIDLFVYRIGREIGSLAAALGGLDALVFTAGIGEHSASLRRSVCLGAAWLGLVLDEAANESGASRISAPGSRVSAWVAPTDEELMIARHAKRLLAGADT